jgi:hypothetical protein
MMLRIERLFTRARAHTHTLFAYCVCDDGNNCSSIVQIRSMTEYSKMSLLRWKPKTKTWNSSKRLHCPNSRAKEAVLRIPCSTDPRVHSSRARLLVCSSSPSRNWTRALARPRRMDTKTTTRSRRSRYGDAHCGRDTSLRIAALIIMRACVAWYQRLRA